MLKTVFKKTTSPTSQEDNFGSSGELLGLKKRKSSDFSVIARGANLVGKVFGSGAIDVLGFIDGDVCADAVFVREGGFINGCVIANNVVVNGRVDGQVFCQTFSIGSQGAMKGSLSYANMSIADGGMITGDCKNEKITEEVIQSLQEKKGMSVKDVSQFQSDEKMSKVGKGSGSPKSLGPK